MRFTVLPDHPAAARSLPDPSQSEPLRVLRHHSGRPWIVGQWSDSDILAVTAGRNSAVFLGVTGAADAAGTGDALGRLLGDARTTSDLDRIARSLPGCFHFAASLDGLVRVQGSLATACQVFYGQVHGVTVAADRPQTVAALAGASVDEEALALRLLSPYGPPWPLADECLWRGVTSLSVGHYLELAPDVPARTRRWWSPPEPELSPEDGAIRLREALSEAVDTRLQHGITVSADLSGGMDSTSLCYLAGRDGAPLITVHYAPLGGANDDSAWAERCGRDLPNGRHLVVPPESADEWYLDSRELAEADIEGPYPFDRSRPTVAHLARLAAHAGSSRHLVGIGADELFALTRRPARAEVTYAGWLASSADRLSIPWAWTDPISWEVAPKLPPWASSDAVRTVRRLLRAAAAPVQPLAENPSRHELIRLSLMNGAIVRRMSRVGQRVGVSFHAPYLDDRVLDSVLATRTPEAVPAGPAKPLLAAALRGSTPDDLLARSTKGPSTHEGHAARRRWTELAELCDDSRLARMGIVDASVLRAALREEPDRARPPMPRDPTRACELWLRALPMNV